MLPLSEITVEHFPDKSLLVVRVPSMEARVTLSNPVTVRANCDCIARAVVSLWGTYYGEISNLVHELKLLNAKAGCSPTPLTETILKLEALVDPANASEYIVSRFLSLRNSVFNPPVYSAGSTVKPVDTVQVVATDPKGILFYDNSNSTLSLRTGIPASGAGSLVYADDKAFLLGNATSGGSK